MLESLVHLACWLEFLISVVIVTILAIVNNPRFIEKKLDLKLWLIAERFGCETVYRNFYLHCFGYSGIFVGC